MESNTIHQIASSIGITASPEAIAAWTAFALTITTTLGRALHALVNGRGLKGIFAGIWYGTNTPAPKAVDTTPVVKLLAVVLLGATLVSGCATTGSAPVVTNEPASNHLFSVDTNGIISMFGTPFEPATVRSVVADITTGAVIIGTTYDTNSVAYLKIVDQLIRVALDQKQDPATLKAALSVVSITDVRDPKVIAGVQLVINLYDKIAGQAVANGIQNSWVYTSPILLGICDGIETWFPVAQ